MFLTDILSFTKRCRVPYSRWTLLFGWLAGWLVAINCLPAGFMTSEPRQHERTSASATGEVSPWSQNQGPLPSFRNVVEDEEADADDTSEGNEQITPWEPETAGESNQLWSLAADSVKEATSTSRSGGGQGEEEERGRSLLGIRSWSVCCG